MNENNQITNQRHLNDFGFACINGYKGNIREYMINKYNGYCEICKRCNTEPMTFDQWRTKDV